MRILSCIIVFIVTIGAYGQKLQDIVYLKNGSVLKGKLITNTNHFIKLETCCGNILAYQKTEVDSIGSQLVNTNKSLKAKGYIAGVSLGTLAGSTVNNRPYPFSIMFEHSVRLFHYVGAGGFGGIEMLNETTVPVGGMVKGYLPLGNATLFIDYKLGYSISLEKPPIDPNYYYYQITDTYGGWMTNAEIGYIFEGPAHNSFFIAMGYRYNELDYKRENWNQERIDRKIIFNRISLRLGIFFY